MSKHIISFAKIVAPPSATAWAQTYHAGNVYAVVSVAQKEENHENPEHAIPSVHVLGKDIINNLEAEYFAIATKNLQTMKEAVSNACKEISDTVEVSVLFAVINNTTLYLFLYGSGCVFIKRGEKFGILLQQKNIQEVVASSGFLEPLDIAILATPQFTTNILQKELENNIIPQISEVAEKLAIKFDDEKYAGSGAILFSVGGVPDIHSEMPKTSIDETINVRVEKEEQVLPSEKKLPSEPIEEKINLDEKPHFTTINQSQQTEENQKRKFPKLSFRQIFFLCLTLFLAALLGISIILTKQKQQTNQVQMLFTSEFPSAKQHFDEGRSLLALNKGLAQDDFAKAKIMLENLKTKLPANSSAEKQVTELLTKVNQAIEPTSAMGASATTINSVDTSASKLLAGEINNPTSKYFTQDANGIYLLDETAISSIDAENKTKSLITNNTWNAIGGFGTYLGNFYVLDKKANQITKFVKSVDGYEKTNYFSSSTPDLSHAVSLTIDGSIWILFDNGSIKKFTKGQPDQFTLKKMKTPIAHPTRIFAKVAMDNLYILDTGSGRVVVIKKEGGTLIAEYSAKELKNAKDIDVDEKNKKIFVLIDTKVFAIEMQ